MLVNGIVVAQFGQRPGKESAKPGKGIAIMPQPMTSSVTISNLWVAPWSGELPDAPKRDANAAKALNKRGKAGLILNGQGIAPVAEKQPEPEKKPEAEEPKPPADLVALTNGDETSGTVESASAEELHLKCDVGLLDVPLKRALMIEFAGAPVPPGDGIRFRLAGKGTLTVKSFSLADGKVVCHSATAGDLSFPISALSEIVFQPRSPQPSAGLGDGRNGSSPNGNQGGVNIRGNFLLNGIQGGVINLR